MSAAKDLTEAGGLAGGRIEAYSGDAPVDQSTELHASERFLRRFGPCLRYCGSLGGWLVWKGTHWVRDEVGEVREMAKEVAKAISAEAIERRDAELQRLGWRVSSARGVENVLSLARSAPTVARRPEDFDRDPYALVTLSGTLDLRTGGLRRSLPEDHNTRCVPHRYDPAAEAPTFVRLFERVQPAQEVRAFLFRWFGYAASGAISEHVLPVWHGSGANGKSTLIEIVSTVLGPYAVPCPNSFLAEQKHEQHPTELARLRAVRLAIASETRAGCALDEAKVKKLTGGDRLTGRFMREDFFDFDPTAKFVLLTNHKPRLRGTDDGIRRRVLLVPFSVSVPPEEQDPTLRETILMAEAPGVLRMIVDGARDWYAAGQRLEPPEAVRAATAAYHASEDVLGRFLDERCELRPCDERPVRMRTKPAVLFEAFTRWAEANGERAPGAGKVLAEQMERRGYVASKANGSRWYNGIGLRPDPEGEPARATRDTTSDEELARTRSAEPGDATLATLGGGASFGRSVEET